MKIFKIKKAILVLGFSVVWASTGHAKNDNDWTGLYGGLNAGGIFNTVYLDANSLGFTSPKGAYNVESNFSSFFSGLQLGYAYQLQSRIVLGVEADYTYHFHKQGVANCTCESNSSVSDKFVIQNPQQGSLRGRIGYAFNANLLPYVTAGGSVADLGVNYRNEGGDYYSKNSAVSGWLVGTGLEWQFAPSWSIRTEYFYVSYPNALNMQIPSIYGLSDAEGAAHVNLNANNIRAAVNYWF